MNFDDTFILKKETKPIPETWCLDDDDDDDCTFARTFMFKASPPPPPREVDYNYAGVLKILKLHTLQAKRQHIDSLFIFMFFLGSKFSSFLTGQYYS